MLLSKLIEEETLHGDYFDIECDVELELAPQGDYRVYLNIALDEPGVIADNVLDAVLEFVSASIPVILVVPFGTQIDTLPLLSIVKNAGISCALTPPTRGSSEAEFEIYKSLLNEVLDFTLENPSFSNEIIPVNGYIEYLMKESLDPESVVDYKPSDPFVITNFHEAMDVEKSDEFKLSLKDIVYSFSAQYFPNLAPEMAFKALADSIYDKIGEATTIELDKFNKQLQADN